MIQSSISRTITHQRADPQIGSCFSNLPSEINNKIAGYLDLKDLCKFIRVDKQIKQDIDHFENFKPFLKREFQYSKPKQLTKEMFALEVRGRNGIKFDHSIGFYESEKLICELYDPSDIEVLHFFRESALRKLVPVVVSLNIYNLLIGGCLTEDKLRSLSSLQINRLSFYEVYTLILSKHLTVEDAVELSGRELKRMTCSPISKLIQGGHITAKEVLELSDDAFDQLKFGHVKDLTQGERVSSSAGSN